MAEPLKVACHLAAAISWAIEERRVDLRHRRQRFGRLRRRGMTGKKLSIRHDAGAIRASVRHCADNRLDTVKLVISGEDALPHHKA